VSTGREEALRYAVQTITTLVDNADFTWLFGDLAGNPDEDDLSAEDEQMLAGVQNDLVRKLKAICP
jgi:hypothetical protein